MVTFLDDLATSLFQNSPNAALFVNSNGGIDAANPAALQYLGFRADQLSDVELSSLIRLPTTAQNQINTISKLAEACKDDQPIEICHSNGLYFASKIVLSEPSLCSDGVSRRVVFIDDDRQVHNILAELETSQDLLSAALGSIPEGFAVYDQEDRLQIFNKGYLDVYPHTQAAIKIGARFEDILRFGLEKGQYEDAGRTEESQAAWLRKRLDSHFNPGSPIIQHLSDGRFIRIEERVLNDGRIVGIRTDITELIETKSLAESLGNALDNIAAPVVFTNIQKQNIEYGNKAALEKLQYSADEIRQLSPFDISQDLDPKLIKNFIARVIEFPGTVQKINTVHFRKDRTSYPCTLNAICETGDNPTRIMIFIQDASEEQEIREELSLRRVQEETLIENLPILVVRSKPDATLIYANELYCQYFGVKLEEVIGKQFLQFIHKQEIRDAIVSNFSNLTPEAPVQTNEQEMLSSKGEKRIFLWTNRMLFKDGQPYEIISVSRDITESKQARAQIEAQAHALSLKNQALEQFAGIVSHDLRSPLRHIRMFGQMLMEEYEAGKSENFGNYIGRMQSNIVRMERLILSLLEFSQVAYKQVNRSHFLLGTAVNEAKDNLSDVMSQSNATVIVKQDIDVFLDYVLFVRLIQNLLDNATKYRQDDVDPIIEIDASNIGSSINISIADNGIGIATRQSTRIFNVFQRLHADESKYAGTGIGLALVKRIVEGHGGTIQLDTDYQDGSKFVLIIPILTL